MQRKKRCQNCGDCNKSSLIFKHILSGIFCCKKNIIAAFFFFAAINLNNYPFLKPSTDEEGNDFVTQGLYISLNAFSGVFEQEQFRKF